MRFSPMAERAIMSHYHAVVPSYPDIEHTLVANNCTTVLEYLLAGLQKATHYLHKKKQAC